MAYGTFKTLEEVMIHFDIEGLNDRFIDELHFESSEIMFNFINKNLSNRRNFISENSICEAVIFPILSIVADKYDLPLWSHTRFDVAPDEGLSGIPDFLIAPVSKTGLSFTDPVICIAEVKKENFDEGWTQAVCEMIAAQRFNASSKKTVYGIATSGEFWKFGKLTDRTFIMDTRAYSATSDLQQLLNVLSWFFREAKKELTRQK